jgi:hypothetical protein
LEEGVQVAFNQKLFCVTLYERASHLGGMGIDGAVTSLIYSTVGKFVSDDFVDDGVCVFQ